jgi:hypothetical protein
MIAAVLVGISLAAGWAIAGRTPAEVPGAKTGTWEELGSSSSTIGLNRTNGPTFRPSLCLDRQGRPVVAWCDETSSNGEIYLRRWDGANWVELGGSATGGGISKTPTPSRAPCVVLDPEDRPVVAWFEEFQGSFEIYVRRWNGESWVEVGLSGSGGGVSRSKNQSNFPVLAVDPAGNPVVCWYGLDALRPGRHQIYLKRWNGKDWIELAASGSGGGVSNSSGDCLFPTLALDRSGNPTVVWYDNSIGNFEIYLRRWDGKSWVELGGSGSGPGISRNAGASQLFLQSAVALDAEGNPTVVWDDDSSGNREIYLRRWTGKEWSELGGSASGGGLSRTPLPSQHPSVVLSKSGHPVVSWQEDTVADTPKVFLRAWDGRSWVALGDSATGGGLGATYGNDVDPVLAVDREGRPVVAWNDWHPLRRPQIYLRRWTGPPVP